MNGTGRKKKKINKTLNPRAEICRRGVVVFIDVTIYTMKAIIFGAGNIGSALEKRLKKEGIDILCIVRSSGTFDSNLNQLKDWKDFVHEADVAFICIPSKGNGNKAFEYEQFILDKGKAVIVCEKASIAHYWNKLKNFNKFKYTASVGGGTKMLKEISKYKPEDIKEIKAVVNGTLNYISSELKNGKDKDQITQEVLEKGYAEPGASNFNEIIAGEINDVLLKTIIMANHSGLFDKVIGIEDIKVAPFDPSKRCIVKMDKNTIQAGFIEDTNAEWLPDSVNNILYINGGKKAYGPGAGAEATVDSMIDDLKSL